MRSKRVINRNKIFDMIDKERSRQDKKFGKPDCSLYEWMGILGEEYGELCEAVNESIFRDENKKTPEMGEKDNIIKEAVQVAAVAVEIIEQRLAES